MFVVSAYGDCGEELKSISKEYDYDEQVKNKCQAIYDEIMNKRYYHGSTQKARETAFKIQNDYLKEQTPFCRILINGKYFGDYKKEVGIKVFEKILEEKKNGTEYLDMRNIEEVINV